MKAPKWALIIAVAVIAGCTSNSSFLKVVPQPSDDQSVFYVDGMSVLRSLGAVAVLAFAKEDLSADSEFIGLEVILQNNTNQPINITSDHDLA